MKLLFLLVFLITDWPPENMDSGTRQHLRSKPACPRLWCKLTTVGTQVHGSNPCQGRRSDENSEGFCDWFSTFCSRIVHRRNDAKGVIYTSLPVTGGGGGVGGVCGCVCVCFCTGRLLNLGKLLHVHSVSFNNEFESTSGYRNMFYQS